MRQADARQRAVRRACARCRPLAGVCLPRLPQSRLHPRTDAARMAGLSGAAVLRGCWRDGAGRHPPRRSKHSYSWRETAFILGLVLVPTGLLVLAMSLGMAAAMLLRRAPRRKLVFNTAVVAIETSVGVAIVGWRALVLDRACGGTTSSRRQHILLLVAATICMHAAVDRP